MSMSWGEEMFLGSLGWHIQATRFFQKEQHSMSSLLCNEICLIECDCIPYTRNYFVSLWIFTENNI